MVLCMSSVLITSEDQRAEEAHDPADNCITRCRHVACLSSFGGNQQS